ncbi:hypothetical protein [Romboutsia sp.]|uniref:hypothetical protein n=1 Tax=Romboutsia sp. TaxID=1965302 RepID=UPI002C916BA1|nr:hypothetical protein [Romboutsia sp.]HSQ89841.1 hypothetical protein [Romboutsia sp.]
MGTLVRKLHSFNTTFNRKEKALIVLGSIVALIALIAVWYLVVSTLMTITIAVVDAIGNVLFPKGWHIIREIFGSSL